MDFFILSLFLLAISFIISSAIELYKSKKLSTKEKVNMAFVLSLMPVLGSIVFYIYQHQKPKYFKR